MAMVTNGAVCLTIVEQGARFEFTRYKEAKAFLLASGVGR